MLRVSPFPSRGSGSVAGVGPTVPHPSELSGRRAGYFVPQHYVDVHTGIDQVVNVVDEFVLIIRAKCRRRDEPDFPAFGSDLGNLGFLDVPDSFEREGEHRWTDERAVAAENAVLHFSGDRL